MAIEITETFEVRAPIDTVWRFLIDPHRVTACLPGAAIEEMVNERSFTGVIRIKVGPITTTYRGRSEFTSVDEQAHAVEMTMEGREMTGGSARSTMTSRLEPLPDGGTRVVVQSTAQITGRVMQLGSRMVQEVGHQIFLEFARCARERLEAEGTGGPEALATAPAHEARPVRALPLLFKAFWAMAARVVSAPFRRRRPAGG